MDSSKHKNRFNLYAVIKNEAEEFDIRTYLVIPSLSWAEMTRTLISWFNDPDLANAAVNKAIKNGGKQ